MRWACANDGASNYVVKEAYPKVALSAKSGPTDNVRNGSKADVREELLSDSTRHKC